LEGEGVTYLALGLYALLILAATVAGDKAQALANEVRCRVLSLSKGRWCRLWYCQIKPVLSTIEGWRIKR